jgi:hypothetical protein
MQLMSHSMHPHDEDAKQHAQKEVRQTLAQLRSCRQNVRRKFVHDTNV